MPSVEELLSVAEVDANTRSAMDSRIEIDADTRIIQMMPQDELFGVESDEKSERKYFKVPKIVGNGVDLSKLQLRINYQNASKIPSGKDMYIVTDATVYNDEWVYFSWELSRKVTQYKGNIYFIVCAIKADSNGNITNEWNTTLAEGKVLEGLEVETSQEQQYQASDYLEQLKQQLLDYSKEIKDTFPSDYTQMQDDIGSLKGDLDTLNQGGLNLKEDFIGQQVNEWLDKHPEATTTVQDGSLTEAKMHPDFLPYIKNGYVTPEMFGAVGDGKTDDTLAIKNAIDSCDTNKLLKFENRKVYKIKTLSISKEIIIDLSGSEIIGTDGVMIEYNLISPKGRAIITNGTLNGNHVANIISGSGKSLLLDKITACLLYTSDAADE